MHNINVLILGGTGLLGKAVRERRPDEAALVVTHCRDLWTAPQNNGLLRLDVADGEATLRLFEKIRPEVTVHLAGNGSVDFAEKNRRESWIVNVGGTHNVIRACQAFGARLVYLSSNAVFDGEQPPYHEDSPRRAVNYYGQLKIEAENAVRESGLDYFIARPILMYGWHFAGARENPVTMWLRLLKQGKPAKVVNDRFWQPLYVDDCADLIWKLFGRRGNGCYNIGGADRLSLYDFALRVAQVFELDPRLIEPVPSSYFPTIAPRPVDTSFVMNRLEEDFGIRPVGVAEGLTRMKEREAFIGNQET